MRADSHIRQHMQKGANPMRTNLNKGLVQILCPYGNWNHIQGMQRVDSVSLKKMQRASRFSMLIGAGIPIYIGHPDENPKSKAKPVGKIVRIFEVHGGIGIEARYCTSAYEKIANGEIKSMSPRWQMEKLPSGEYRPIRLISAGLTNNPNIEGSGRVINAQDYILNKNLVSESKEIIKQCKAVLTRASHCKKSATKISKALKSAEIQARLEKTKISAEKNAEKSSSEVGSQMTLTQLAHLANQRSKTLGESYSKSFAYLRKQHNFHKGKGR